MDLNATKWRETIDVAKFKLGHCTIWIGFVAESKILGKGFIDVVVLGCMSPYWKENHKVHWWIEELVDWIVYIHTTTMIWGSGNECHAPKMTFS